ncbi:MAG TPA: pyruvate dehydrogenase (acetyl-transferring), homodimeric type, partial [Coxiellaceae bacterium]|nr:pyruvate dehydrogenase (acetyl-transferring), homodimeric type [Coxiellaceae bacterium]
LTEKHLDGFRQELSKPQGLSSYPHPWLMPDFWQFPTVSMGLGPLMAIFQARFLQYLQNRHLVEQTDRKIWAFCGDGEMGEPESLGLINIAGREKLDNLIFVINCNLQRLDGPVWGGGQIIQELESIYRGAKWNVIKVIWGSEWDELFAQDSEGVLKKRLLELVDGEYQDLSSKDGAYLREHFFGKDPQLKAMVDHLSDESLRAMLDGGHDPQKVYAAYKAAVEHKGQPTVILAKTVKGFGMGKSGEALNRTHSTKKMSLEDLRAFAKRFDLPLTDQQLENLEFVKPKSDSPEIRYLLEKRKQLGGYVPSRLATSPSFTIPPLHTLFEKELESTHEREISSTMAFVRVLSALLKDKTLQKHVVPIMADEARTFGMEGLFRQIGIYSTHGQEYTPEDKHQLMYYREAIDGQLLQEGISEAGGMASWIAAGTSYMANGVPMIPFFVYYSMFGYQRFGDLVWLAGDIRARGFIVGGTAGRTTLAGEGLQHQDGHNYLSFSYVPNCISYDPTFSYELAVIIHHGLKVMYEDQHDVYFYFTVMNENYTHPAMPQGAEEGIIKGMYLFREAAASAARRVQMLGSGAILREVIQAADILEQQFQVSADIWSVTSFNELRKDIRATHRYNRLHPNETPQRSYVKQCLNGRKGPVIAATDYIQLVSEQIRLDVENPYYTLGTDGFGRSDLRTALRDFFEVDAKMIAYLTLVALADQGEFDKNALPKAMEQLGVNPNKPDPVTL